MFKSKKFIVLSLVLLLILNACNSGGNTNNEPTNNVVVPVTPPSNPNLTINVSHNNGDLCSNLNIPCVSVTIYSPTNPESCQTIDNVLIDSGSVGLRIFKSVLNSNLVLPPESIGNSTIANCVGYGDLSANWGPVALANISLGNQSTIQSIPMQLIDPLYADGGAKCLKYLDNNPSGSSYNLETSPADFGFNGILGVAPIIYDNITSYFICNDSSCDLHEPMMNSQEIANPIAFLPESYESGITFKFPTLGNNGATGAVGYAVFGVGTNNDNTFESGIDIYHIYTDGSSCNGLFICMNTILSNTSIRYGFLDTGSNFFYFNDNNISSNNGYYNPNSMLTLFPSNTSESGKIITSFNIANFDSLYNNTGNTAFNNNGASGSDGFLDYGLPFFFGKTVYICFAGMTCNGVDGPYWAF